MKEGVVIEASGISKKYRDKYAVRGLSFEVRRNTIFGLLGSNGAGKSTTLHMLTGLLSKDEGGLYIFDETVHKKYSRRLKRRVAIVPQEISLYKELTIYDNLYFFGRAYGLSRKVVLERIHKFQDTLGLGNLKRAVKTLSGGYQRRVSFGVALIGDPDLIILDEALVGIDIETKKLIVDLLIKLKKTKTIVITTHSIDDAERMCDDILLLHEGRRVLYGETKKLIRDYEEKQDHYLEVVFGSKVKLDEFVKELKLRVKNEVKVDEMKVLVKFEKEIMFDLKSVKLDAVMALVESYRGDVVDFGVKRFGLEGLMMEVLGK